MFELFINLLLLVIALGLGYAAFTVIPRLSKALGYNLEGAARDRLYEAIFNGLLEAVTSIYKDRDGDGTVTIAEVRANLVLITARVMQYLVRFVPDTLRILMGRIPASGDSLWDGFQTTVRARIENVLGDVLIRAHESGAIYLMDLDGDDYDDEMDIEDDDLPDDVEDDELTVETAAAESKGLDAPLEEPRAAPSKRSPRAKK